MRKALIIAALLLVPFLASARASMKGDDSKITYIGRTSSKSGTTSFDWSGVTMIVEFEGTSLTVIATDTKTNSFNVWIDKEPSFKADNVLNLNGTKIIAKGLAKGKHTIILQKRTEGEQGLTTIKSLSTDGSFLQARELKERRIEFIGDSYTCGYGTESDSRDDPFKADEENCNLAYAAIVGRFFDADIQLVSHSGRGIARNYGGASPEEMMPDLYLKTYDCKDGPEWSDNSFSPALVVVYLGTNDFSTGLQPSLASWCAGYSKLLNKVRENYPDVPVLCVASKADPQMGDYVKEAIMASGLKNVHWTDIQDMAHNDTTDLGASWHPNYEGQRKVAGLMIPYISTITGWEMPHKVIE